MTKLWGGRFSEQPASELLAFTESISFDVALVRDDCAVLAAHCRALARAGILTDDEATTVARALDDIAGAVERGEVVSGASDEDVHTLVERLLLERVPEVAAKTRAGLSRNDRVAAAARLWLKREGGEVVRRLCSLVETLVERAREHAATLMPGYTHLQRAQPVTLGHHLLAHAFAFERDARRMLDAIARADVSPLGAGALAGTTLGLDADATARDLGFASTAENSLDAVAARDHVAEFLAAAAICGVHCSRLGEEVVLWTTTEFGFARLSDAHATGSSLMPQKKNPDIAELARGKAGRLLGAFTSLVATLKGLPLAYNRDLQEDKEPLFDAVRTLRLQLPALTAMIASITFDVPALESAAGDPALLATDAADALVRDGVPFREAHETVGRRFAEADVGGTDVEAARAALASRSAPGPSPSSVSAQLAALERSLAMIRATVG